jgi:hypothetical protein
VVPRHKLLLLNNNNKILFHILKMETESAIPVNYKMDTRMGKIILVFFILITIFWLLLYTFNPAVVQGPISNRRYIIKGDPISLFNQSTAVTMDDFDAIPDTGRCFVGSLILSLVVVLLLWLFRACY